MTTNNSNLITQNHNLNLKTNLRHRSYQFSLSIIYFITTFSNKRIYWIFTDQLLRAATSVGANIIEAKASSSKKDFIRYYQIALKSANETTYWLSLLRDSKLISNKTIESLIGEAEEICKMLASSLLTLKGKTKF